MKLNVKSRVHERKSDAAKLRRAGEIPAIIYHKGKAGEAVSVSEAEFSSGLREMPKGRLSTTTCVLESEGKKTVKALVKDIQYHPVSYRVVHLDFEEVKDDVPVKVNVPLMIVGVIDSVGVKQGGMVRQVIRSMKVECLPKDIPESLQVDVKDMNIGDIVRLKDLNVPNTVRPLIRLDSVAVSMVKR